MTHLARGDWPDLENLSLAHNCLASEAITRLFRADWPHLVSLNISECHKDNLGIVGLCEAHWPKLTCMRLQSRGFGFGSHRLLRMQEEIHDRQFTGRLGYDYD